jgi:hypothetical protein
MGARKKGDEGVRVPELEQRELEDGTRFCQVSERSALAPTVRNGKKVAGAKGKNCLERNTF